MFYDKIFQVRKKFKFIAFLTIILSLLFTSTYILAYDLNLADEIAIDNIKNDIDFQQSYNIKNYGSYQHIKEYSDLLGYKVKVNEYKTPKNEIGYCIYIKNEYNDYIFEKNICTGPEKEMRELEAFTQIIKNESRITATSTNNF